MLSFRTQLTVIVLASLTLVGLAWVLIRDVITQTEGRLLADARQQSVAACRELRIQFEERTAFAVDDPLEELPLEAQDLSLQGLSATVLRSYEGVEGGFHLTGRLVGFRGEQPGLTAREETLVLAAVERARAGEQTAIAEAEWEQDLAVVTASAAAAGGAVAWTMKRLSNVRDPGVVQRRWLLAALVLSALLGMGGIISIWYSLQRGVNSISEGLAALERDFHYRLPEGRGDFSRIASAINRMTARRTALETELRRQDRLAALGKAVAGVAHEIRNPLNSIKLTLELLDRRLKKGTVQRNEVAGAVGEVDRLDEIVARLLAFGRPALADRRVQDLAPLVRQAVSLVREPSRRRDVQIAIDDVPDSARADVDGPQIQQVLINLLLNAIEASPPGETIRVSVEMSEGHLSLAVADRGSGIPEEARPHVFDVYFTTKPEGVGLGLSVSREIVANHGGRLDFDTGEHGATFRVQLPVERIVSSEAQTKSARSRG
ncbi:MAG: GHKL domain-containing protein [bacterium]|nr:GHKL domain-containing protein [bacterium]